MASIGLTGFDTVSERSDDDKFEMQFASGKPVVDHDSLEYHTPSSGQGFSIRAFVAQVRSKDVRKCWPFSEGLFQVCLKDGDNPLLAPSGSAEHGTSGPVIIERERLSQTQSTLCEEKEDDTNSQRVSREAQECSNIVRSLSLEESDRNNVEASNSPPLELDQLQHPLAEAPPSTEMSNAKEDMLLNNRQVEDYNMGDETETKPKCARSAEMKDCDGGDTEEEGVGMNVCPSFNSPTINAVNAHMDNCLRSPPEEKKQRKIMSSKSKAQKKRRSIADIFACAPPVRLSGTTSSVSMSEEDIFEKSSPCPCPPLPLHSTDAVSALDSAKANPFECGKSAELIEPHRLGLLQVGSKSKRKRKTASGGDSHYHCSSPSTPLKDVIKTVVKNPRRQKIANALDTICYINPEAEIFQEINKVPMKNNILPKSRSRIPSRKNYLEQFHASLRLQHSNEQPQEKQTEKLQLQDVVIEERADVSVPNSDNKKRQSSVKQQKKEPPKKQKPGMFVRDSKGRFASVAGKDQTKKHRHQKGSRRLRRESRASLNLCVSSMHKDTNFPINVALSNARLFNATNRADTPSPCIDAIRSSNSITNPPQIPDLNALDGTVSQIKQAGSTPASIVEVSLQKNNDKLQESSMMNIGMVVTAQSSVPESIIGKCAASYPTTDSGNHLELQQVHKMNSGTGSMPEVGTTVRMHQKIQDDSPQSSSSRTDACRLGGQDLFIISTPCRDKSVDECQNNKKVVRLMGKSLVVDTELPPLFNRGNNNINVPTKHLIFEQLHSKEQSSVNNEAKNQKNLVQALGRNTPADESQNSISSDEPENNTSLKQTDTAKQFRPLGQTLSGDGSSKQTSLASAAPPLSSRPVWLVPKETGFNSGRKSDFVRSRFSIEHHDCLRAGGLEIQPKKKVSLSDNSNSARPPKPSRLSGEEVRDRSAAAHSIGRKHLFYSPSSPGGSVVKDGQAATCTPSAKIHHVALEKEKSALKPGCIARDYSRRQINSNKEVAYPLCVYDSIGDDRPPGLLRCFPCMQFNNNDKAIVSPFAYKEPRALFSLGESELKSPKEKRCITDNGRPVLDEASCKSVYHPQSLSGKPLGNQIEMESSSAGQVAPSTVIDLTNDSAGDSDVAPCFTCVEADRFPPPNRGLGNGEAAKYPIHCRWRKLSGGAKHILKPFPYSSSDNRPLPIHYIFALPKKEKCALNFHL